jgi:hypothetical protein
MLPACCWALPLAAVTDPLSPKSTSPLSKVILPLSTLAFETETLSFVADPM